MCTLVGHEMAHTLLHQCQQNFDISTPDAFPHPHPSPSGMVECGRQFELALFNELPDWRKVAAYLPPENIRSVIDAITANTPIPKLNFRGCTKKPGLGMVSELDCIDLVERIVLE